MKIWRLLTPGGKIGAIIIGILALISVFGPSLVPYDPLTHNMRNRLSAPSLSHFFGTDSFGRDLFSRIIVGARLSLVIAVGASILAAILGIGIGITSAVAGGWFDVVMMRVNDAFLSFPGILLGLALMALLGPGSMNVMGAMVIAFTPRFVRLVRNTARTVTGVDYVIAARAIGASPFRIATRHILPNILGSILVMFTFTVALGIILEASLSFLGLGAHGRIPTWGSIASEGQSYLRVFPWTSTLSGLAITLAVLGFNILGDNLRDIFDPKLRD